MRKVLITMLLALSMILIACGGEEEASSKEDEPKKEEKTGNEEKESTEISDSKFDNGDYVYEIKSTEQITGKSDMQILAIELSFTNNTEEPVSPWMALGISAEQETETTVETLTGANGRFPDDYKPDLVKMGDTDIKPGATVDAVIGFEILYPGSDVKLSNFSFEDEKLFEKIVETTK